MYLYFLLLPIWYKRIKPNPTMWCGMVIGNSLRLASAAQNFRPCFIPAGLDYHETRPRPRKEAGR